MPPKSELPPRPLRVDEVVAVTVSVSTEKVGRAGIGSGT